ncbi:YunG family protein [Saccharibacillus alkalitolerans]|uniref:YunG n=1 Tax=Saccharibacillus alkalitolerans TaxID=2705290 RepID=A0ABX0FBE7_9BACL|nr:hypothetical protein [Saccharibacillus alkalitolerans]NGZ77695.1 hypothetical protein [Saccharibacillus alkalitolerans]
MNNINHEKILKALFEAWSIESSSKWTVSNPASGQCGVTAIVIQEIFGGEIVRTKISDGAWHYYNEIHHRRYDFTESQFDVAPQYEDIRSTREEAFSDTNLDQYTYLIKSFKNALGMV